VLNAPLFLIAAKLKGLRFLKRTLYATVMLSFVMFLTNFIPMPEFTQGGQGLDMILTALFGGVLAGAGIGTVFACSSTTGGSDLLATIIHHKKKHMDVSKILLMIDYSVIALGFFAFGPINAMYALIAVFVSSRMITAIDEGLTFSRAAFIISDRSGEIADLLMTQLERGATALRGTGMYTRTEKDVLLCVVSKKEIVELKEIAAKCDPAAFVIVTDVREILGYGFQKL
jgi:uncharacterized membrane-anchored protein YitT (DUF2179 family)